MIKEDKASSRSGKSFKIKKKQKYIKEQWEASGCYLKQPWEELMREDKNINPFPII